MRYLVFLKNTGIVLFIILNLFAIVHANRSEWFRVSSEEPAAPGNSSILPPKVRYYLSRYSHIVGLDNRWEMFSYMYRTDWQFVFKGKYKTDSEEVVLPMSGQSKRNFFDHWLFDFREAKLKLNIYGIPEARQLYALQLCKQFSKPANRSLEYIACDLVSYPIVPRDTALRTGTHLGERAHIHRLDTTFCLNSL